MNRKWVVPDNPRREESIEDTLLDFSAYCEECEGRGWIWLKGFETCPTCEGRGLWETEDLERFPQLHS